MNPASAAPISAPIDRRDLEQDADADVGESLAHVRRGRAGRRRDDRDERRADRVTQIDVKDQRQHRHDDDPTAEPGERAEQAGGERCRRRR